MTWQIGLAASLLGGLFLAVFGFGSAQATHGGIGGGGGLVGHAGPIGHGPMLRGGSGMRFAERGERCDQCRDPTDYGYRDRDCYCLFCQAQITGNRYWWSQYELCRL
jgi:hypothetical protein